MTHDPTPDHEDFPPILPPGYGEPNRFADRINEMRKQSGLEPLFVAERPAGWMLKKEPRA